MRPKKIIALHDSNLHTPTVESGPGKSTFLAASVLWNRPSTQGQAGIRAWQAQNTNIEDTKYKGKKNRGHFIEVMGFPIEILYLE